MAIDADLNTGAITEKEARDAVIRTSRKRQASLVPWMVQRNMLREMQQPV